MVAFGLYLLCSSLLCSGQITMDANREGLALASILCMTKFGHMDVTTTLGKVASGLGHLSCPLGAFLGGDLFALCRWDQSTFFAVLDVHKELRYKRDTQLICYFLVQGTAQSICMRRGQKV